MISSISSTLTSIAVLGLLAVPAAAIESPTPDRLARAADAFTMMPGVIAQPEAKVIFSMGAGGDVEALGFDNGRVLWNSTEASRPLGLYGQYLIAQVEPAGPGTLELAFLRIDRDGRTALRSSIALPANVLASIDDGLGRRFAANVTVVNGTPVLAWSYEKRRITGAMPSAVSGSDQVERHAGRLRFDPVAETWRVEAGAAPVLAAPRPDLSSAERLADVEGTQFHSADRNHVMTSERIADGRVFDRYRWQVRSRVDGGVRGEVRAPVSWAPHFVADSTLVRESRPHLQRVGGEVQKHPRQLLAFDIGNGREQWSRAVRDTEYRGPFPP